MPVFKPVWEYLLSNTTPPLNINSIEFLRGAQIIARPAVGASAKYYRLVIGGNGFDANSKAVVNGIETETEFVSANTLRAKLSAGKIGAVGSATLQIRGANGALSNTFNF